MANHTLQITRGQQSRSLHIHGKGKPLKVVVHDQTAYQIFDAEGKLLFNPETKESGYDLWVYLDRKAVGQPDLILQDYLRHYPVVDLNDLKQMYTTFATASGNGAVVEGIPLTPVIPAVAVAPKATVVAWAAGAAGTVAALAAIAKNGSDKDDVPPPAQTDNSVNQPTVTLNTVPTINQANAKGKTTLSGSLGNVDKDVTELKVNVEINGQTKTVTLNPTDKTWSLQVNNSELAQTQGNRSISVSATAKDAASNTATSAKVSQNYLADTMLNKPTVTVKDIGNIATTGKTTLSGTVSNVDADATVKSVTVKIGNTSKTAAVKGNTWSVEVNNSELAAANKVSATATVGDKAGNSQTSAAAEKGYTVTQPDTKINTPTVTLNTVPTINQANVSGKTKLSGSLGNVDKDVTELKVNVEINGQTKTVSVQPKANSWSLEVNNSELAQTQGNRSISVSATAKDAASNTATSAKVSQNYLADTMLNKPTVTVKDIGNIATTGKTTLSGTVSNVDADATVKSVTVKIGNTSKTATVSGNTWSVEVNNSELAAANKVSATATVGDKAGNSQTSAAAEKGYTVTQPDTKINTPTVTLNTVPTINQANVGGKTKLSGSLGNVDKDVTELKVNVEINGQTKTVTLNPTDKTWSLQVNNSELAQTQGNRSISVSATAKDAASNTATSAKVSQNYLADTMLNKPTVTVKDIGNIATTGKTTLSGTVGNVDNDATVKSVTVKIGNTSKTAAVNGNTWSVEVNNSELAAANKVSATATVGDKAGNSQTSAAAEKGYTVTQPDTKINTPTVTLNTVPTINQANIGGKTKLSGSLKNIDADVTELKVNVEINGQTKTVTVQPKANSWSLEVNNSELAQTQGNRSISVSATAKDAASNTATSAKVSQNYLADTMLNKPTVTVKDIGNIAATGKTTLSGTVGNVDNDATVKSVTVKIGNTSKTATVSGNTWSVEVNNSELAAANKVSATATVGDKAGNSQTSAAAEKSYTVDRPDEIVSVRISSIDSDNVVGADRLPPLAEVRGKIDASAAPLFTKSYNREAVQSVVLQIGGKQYEAAVDKTDFTFRAMIPEAELRAANGQSITTRIHHLQYQKEHAVNSVVDVVKNRGAQAGGVRITEDYYLDRDVNFTAQAGKLKVVLEGGNIAGSSGSYSVRADGLPKPQSQIEGFVGGHARAGDRVEVEVHGKQYSATVKNDKTFAVKVDTAELLADNDKKVTATLISGSKRAQDSSDYLTAMPDNAAQGKFVNPHGKIPYQKLPYFIRNLYAEWNDDIDYGYLPHMPVGKNGSIKYYIFTNDDVRNINTTIARLNRLLAITRDRLKAEALYYQIDELRDVQKGNPQGFSAANQGKIDAIFQHVADHSGLKFKRVNKFEDADVTFFINKLDDGTDGYAHYGGNVHLNPDSFAGDKFNYQTALHELLHSLGMKHPHRDDHDPKNVPVMAANEDHVGLTLLSYEFEDFNQVDSLRVFDLAYLHYRFGVNPEHRKGNDVYTFKAFNRHSVDGDIYIWDGGGVDTFDASGEAQGVTVNLTPGSWIYSGSKANQLAVSEHRAPTKTELLAGTDGKSLWTGDNGATVSGVFTNTFVKGQAFIGYGTQIENLIGSAHNDTLTGNNADNAIYGGAGDDTINGGKGNDWLDGGSGNDTLVGGVGDDVYIVGEAGDKVQEADNQGTDQVYSSINYTLGSFVENLTLLGKAQTGTGNDMANKLEGNNLDNTLDGKGGNDTLNGGGGNDTLTGGAGNDTFVFSSVLDGSIDTITDFKKGEDKIALSRAVFTALNSPSDIAAHIKYDNATGKLSYDADGASSGAAVEFAKLNSGLGTLEQNQFTLIA